METTSLAATRIRRFLEQEPVVWLSTVRPDGRPHLVPIWFWWDGEAMLVFSKPDAQKVRNLRANPSVMLALGDAEDDFDVGMLEGRAELLDRPTVEVMPRAHLAKYARQLAAIGLSAEEYAATYSQALRIVPSRALGWHGRGMPRSARLAGAPHVSIQEPRRAAGWLGEPLSGPFVGRRARPFPGRPGPVPAPLPGFPGALPGLSGLPGRVARPLPWLARAIGASPERVPQPSGA